MRSIKCSVYSGSVAKISPLAHRPDPQDNPGKSTYTLVVSSRAQVDAWHTYLVQKNPSRVVATFPEFSSKFDVYAFNFYDTDSNHGLGCYRWEVQYFEDPAWPQPSL